jgi:hypothetical protein
MARSAPGQARGVDAERLRFERIADSEGVGRLGNEHLRKSWPPWPPDERRHVRCECADDACKRPLLVTGADYERVRSDPMHFLVLPGHEVPEAEDVVERADGFWVVRKHEDMRARVEDSDPRTPS